MDRCFYSGIAVMGLRSMTQKSPRLRATYRSLFAGGALALPLGLYASGFPTVSGAFLLSSLLVFTIAIVKSGALATCWLAGEARPTIENATRYELAKAFICAALAIDALFGGARVMDRYRLWHHNISRLVVLTMTGLLAIAAGLFLTRWFAGYLFTRR
jgi:hypothetical protein